MQGHFGKIAFMAAIIAFTTGPRSDAMAQSERPLFVPGEIIFKLKPEVSASARQRLMRSHRIEVLRELIGSRSVLSRLPAGTSPIDASLRLRRLPEVVYADPNYYRYVNAVPNDPRFPEMWGLDNHGQTGGTASADIDALVAWESGVGSQDVVIAVIDTGMDRLHEDLAFNLFVNLGEIPDNGLDDDGNGFVDDVSGWDFRDGDNDPDDDDQACFGHGTHTAGTAGAVGNNGIGVTGVAQQVRILPLKAFGLEFQVLCVGNDADLIDAIGYASMMGAAISNNPWGGAPFSQALMDAIAAGRHLFVAPAGNLGDDNDRVPFYPASYDLDNIISVAATDHNDELGTFSNFGSSTVDLAAPGVDILSTLPGDNYGLFTGTSMAASHVAGAAAVLLGADLTLTTHELKFRLTQSTDFKNLPLVTGGRLDLASAVFLSDSLVKITVSVDTDTQVLPGGVIEFDLVITNSSDTAQGATASLRVWTPAGKEAFLAGPVSLTFHVGETLVHLVQSVPPGLEAGTYRVIGRVDNLSTGIFDEDQLTLTVD